MGWPLTKAPPRLAAGPCPCRRPQPREHPACRITRLARTRTLPASLRSSLPKGSKSSPSPSNAGRLLQLARSLRKNLHFRNVIVKCNTISHGSRPKHAACVRCSAQTSRSRVSIFGSKRDISWGCGPAAPLWASDLIRPACVIQTPSSTDSS